MFMPKNDIFFWMQSRCSIDRRPTDWILAQKFPLNSLENGPIGTSGVTNPGNQGLDESESLAISDEIRANLIRIRIPNLKKWFVVI
jgi:hypothetical protein